MFDSSSLTLRYFDRDGLPLSASKGSFEMSPADLFSTMTQEHGRPHEVKITSKGQTLYATADNEESATSLLLRIDTARRAKIAGDDGAQLLRVEDGERAAAAGVMPGETGAKCFTWGVGSMLAINAPKVQGMAFPQRVQGLKPP